MANTLRQWREVAPATSPAITTPRASFHDVAVLMIAIAVTTSLGALAISRAGYALDEEITAAVVPAISQHGLPRLPSGVLYLRGLPYLYAAWLAGEVAEHTLQTYRLVSLACAVGGIVAMFVVGKIFGNATAGAIGALLLSAAPQYVAASAFARPYSMYVLGSLLTLLAFHGFVVRGWRPWWFLLLLAASRLLHEFGLIALLIPVAYAVVIRTDPGTRRRLRSVMWRSFIVAAAVELIIYAAVQESIRQRFILDPREPPLFVLGLPPLPALHVFAVATPLSFAGVALPLAALGVALSRRAGARIVTTACIVLGMIFQLGAMVAFVFMAMVARPARATRYVVVGVLTLTASATLWTTHTLLQTGAEPQLSIASSLISGALHYPFGGFRYLWRNFPVTAAAFGFVVAWMIRRGGDGDAHERRAVALLSIVALVAFGAIGVEIRPRFFLLLYPVLLVVAARSIDVCHFTPSIQRAACSLLVAAMLGGQYLFGKAARVRTVGPLGTVGSADVVICNEELACMHLLGRVDYLLATTEVDRRQYSGQTGDGLRGLYAYTPVLTDVAKVESIVRGAACDKRCVLVLLKTEKVEYASHVAMAEELRDRYGGELLSSGDRAVLFLGGGGRASTTPAL